MNSTTKLRNALSFLLPVSVWSGLVLNVVKRGGGLGLVSLQSVAGHTVHHLKSSLGVLAGTGTVMGVTASKVYVVRLCSLTISRNLFRSMF